MQQGQLISSKYYGNDDVLSSDASVSDKALAQQQHGSHLQQEKKVELLLMHIMRMVS